MMQRIGLFYASTTGNTEAVAERIAAMIEEVPVDPVRPGGRTGQSNQRI